MLEDEGVERMHCMDCPMTDFCMPCVRAVSIARKHGLPPNLCGCPQEQHTKTYTLMRTQRGDVDDEIAKLEKDLQKIFDEAATK